MTTSPSTPTALYPLGPTLEFLQRIWALNHALERRSAVMARALGITSQQRFLIRCLGKYPGLPAGHLAALLHVDPATITVAVRRLEAKGLVERQRATQDKRRASLGLTAAGRKLDTPTDGTVESSVEQVMRGLSAAELETTSRVLDRLAEALVEAPRRAPRARPRG